MKRFFTRVLVTALAALIVTFAMEGIDKLSASRKIEKLAGTYMTMETIEADMVERMLANRDFYPEEIALIDLNSQTVPCYKEFRDNKTYVTYYDIDAFRSSVETFFRNAFDRMYEGRSSLASLYDVDIVAMTKAEFQNYYASLYNQPSFAELITVLASDAYNYDELTQDTGTFSIEDDRIICNIVNPFSTTVMRYELSGNTLTLYYSDAMEIYNRVS